MARNLVQQILADHLVEGQATPGTAIGVRVDQTLTQDGTGTMVALEFEALGLDRVRTRLSASYVDHNLLQTDFKNGDDHRFLRGFAQRHGLWFSPPGNGICHQLHLLNFGRPGETLLGSDSHTPHAGGVGMLAIGAGGLDVAVAMAGQPFYLACPKVLGVKLLGRLSPGVDAKNLILELLRRLGVKGGVGRVLEYCGPGVASLSVSERAAVCNMGAELGATSSLFPSDENTRAFLAAQGREADYRPLEAEPGCAYDETSEVDLAALVPLVARPGSPDHVVPAAELAGVPAEQIIVGSCGGAAYEDLMALAQALKGKRIAPGVCLEVNPGSRRALAQIAENGALGWLLAAGARLHQAGCLGCIGVGQSPATGINSLRTFPRNFPGRSGTQGDQVYLCGPLVAAASALTGRITDPRTLGLTAQVPPAPPLRPEALTPPPADGGGIAVPRGPNIATFPDLEELPAELACVVGIKVGDNVTTDHIMPAGNAFLPLRSNLPVLSRYVFHYLDPAFAERARAEAPVCVVGGENYGQGSSREHAALAPRFLGVRIKLAKSFARIHRANLVNFGVVPLLLADPADYDRLQPGQRIAFPGLRAAVLAGEETITGESEGRSLAFRLLADPREREVLAAGGLLGYIRRRL